MVNSGDMLVVKEDGTSLDKWKCSVLYNCQYVYLKEVLIFVGKSFDNEHYVFISSHNTLKYYFCEWFETDFSHGDFALI